MTMDRTLRHHGRLVRSRSVLTRAERIQQMIDDGKFDPDADCPLGLPKLRVRHSKAGTKTKKAAEEVPAAGVTPAEAEGAAPAGPEAAERAKGAKPS